MSWYSGLMRLRAQNTGAEWRYSRNSRMKRPAGPVNDDGSSNRAEKDEKLVPTDVT